MGQVDHLRPSVIATWVLPEHKAEKICPSKGETLSKKKETRLLIGNHRTVLEGVRAGGDAKKGSFQ